MISLQLMHLQALRIIWLHLPLMHWKHSLLLPSTCHFGNMPFLNGWILFSCDSQTTLSKQWFRKCSPHYNARVWMCAKFHLMHRDLEMIVFNICKCHVTKTLLCILCDRPTQILELLKWKKICCLFFFTTTTKTCLAYEIYAILLC